LTEVILPAAGFLKVSSSHGLGRLAGAEREGRSRRALVYLLAFDLLKPGGYFVLTIARFLNLRPFSWREVNAFGTYVSVRALAEFAPFDMVEGTRAEWFGYPEFDTDAILRDLEEPVYHVFHGAKYPLPLCRLSMQPGGIRRCSSVQTRG
jgi:hypothetical protein